MIDTLCTDDVVCPYSPDTDSRRNPCIGHDCAKWVYTLQTRPKNNEELFLWCSCFSKDEDGIFVEGECPLYKTIFDENGVDTPSKERNPHEKTIPDVYWCYRCKFRYGSCGGQKKIVYELGGKNGNSK